MLPVAGVPFVTHQLARARDAGVDRVVLATSYLPEVFSAHFGDGQRLRLDLCYVTEHEPLGTGGGIRNVADALRSGPDEPVLVLNGDVLSGHDIRAQVELHRRVGAAVTLYLRPVDDVRAFGMVPTDADGRVTAFLEKPKSEAEVVTHDINAGCYVFTRSVIDSIPPGRPVSVERETFPGLLAAGAPVMGYVDPAYWLDLGTPAAFVQGSRDLVLGVAPSPAVPPVTNGAVILPGAQVAAGACVDGGSAVGVGATVQAGAVVSGSVLFDGAVVAAGARVVDSAVGRSAYVGARTSLADAVIGDGATIGMGNELIGGARVWPGTQLADGALRFSTDR